jgi:hypothetical protein
LLLGWRTTLPSKATGTESLTSSTSTSVAACSASHNQIHKGHRVCLDFCVELRLVLLQGLHKFLEEGWVLKHSLP